MKKIQFVSLSAVVALMAALPACSSKKAQPEQPAAATLSYSTTVAGEETAQAEFPVDEDGYIHIFNGADTTGWRGFGKDHVPARWLFEDSCLHFVRGEGEGGDITFAHEFENFDLAFDWKVTEGANSGVFYLAQEAYDADGNFYIAYMSAPEYQILDNVNHPDAARGVDGNRQSASLYDMIPANPQNSKPFGEWNTARIVCENGTVTHYQNGEVVLTYELWTPEWTERLQNSKFAEAVFPQSFVLLNNKHAGKFAFQDHGDEVFYRNIRVKEL